MRGLVRIAGLGIADSKGDFVTRAVEVVPLTWAGIEGDRHAGLTMKAGVRQRHLPKNTEIRNARQLSLLSAEELLQIATNLQLPRVEFTWLGANLLLEGAPGLTRLPPSTRMVFPSGAAIVIDGDNEPCRKAGKAIVEALGTDQSIATRFVKAAWDLRGLVAWVERPGVIRVGDEVTCTKR